MVTCNNCFHCCVCPIADGVEYADEQHIRDDCEYFVDTADVVPKSEVVKEFTRRFEMYIGNCTFTLGQTNDIQYALKKAAEDMIGGK